MIGDKIYKFRKSRNLSQEEFANSIGVTRQIVSKWESNQSIPGVDKLKKISDVYEIPYDELLNNTDYEGKKSMVIRKYILLFILMIIIQVIFIFLISNFSNKEIKNDYKCVGSQTYIVMEIYDSEDSNYMYVTLKKDDTIKTVKVSKVIGSLINVDKKYEFVFKSNDSNNDMEHIFDNNEIINVIETDKDTNIINCD